MDDNSNKVTDPASEVDPSSATFARDAASDLAGRIYARDAGAGPLSGSYDWQQHPSVLSDPLAEEPSDRLVSRIYKRDAAEPAGEPSVEEVFESSTRPPVRQARIVQYKRGPYQFLGRGVVIPRKSAQVTAKNNKNLTVGANYLPPICVGSGDRLPSLGTSIAQQSGGHAKEQELICFAGRKPLLWGCLYVVLLLISETIGGLVTHAPEMPGAVVAGDGSSTGTLIARMTNSTFGFVKYGPAVFPKGVMVTLGILLFVMVSIHLGKAYLARRTCRITYGFSTESWSSFKQQFLVSVGFVLIAIGVIVSCLLYSVPYIWIFKYAANLGLYCVMGGIWMAWNAWHPLQTVSINDDFVHFRGGRFLRLHRNFLGAMHKFPTELRNSLRRHWWDREETGYIDSLFRKLLSFVGSPQADNKDEEDEVDIGLDTLIAEQRTPEDLRDKKVARRQQKQKKVDRDQRIEDINTDVKLVSAGLWDEDQAAFSAADQIYEDESQEMTGATDVSPRPSVADDSATEPGKLVAITSAMAEKFLGNQDSVDLWRGQTITADVARMLRRSVGYLELNSLTRLSPAAAAELALHEDDLVLNGLTSLPVEVAAELASHKHDLWLDGLTSLSPEAAEVLAPHQGGIHLGGLTTLDPDLAEVLATYQESLELDGLTTLSLEAAQALANHNESLALNGLTSLSVEVAQELANHVGRLDLDGLTSLSPEVAQALARHVGELELDGLTSLSKEVAQALAQNQGPLTLDAVTKVTIPVAQALAEHQDNLDIGVLELGIGHAKAFGKHQGNLLTLFNLAGLNPKAARGLAKYPGLLVYQSDLLGKTTVEILNDGGHF